MLGDADAVDSVDDDIILEYAAACFCFHNKLKELKIQQTLT